MHSPCAPAERLHHRQAGTVLIEFSLVLVPMLALIFLMLDTAWMIFAKASMQEAVREGVRFGVTGGAGCASLNACIQQVVELHSANFVNAQNVAAVVTIRYSSPSDTASPPTALTGCSATAAGNILQVSISGASIAPMAPLLRSKTPFSMGASAADAMEASTSACP